MKINYDLKMEEILKEVTQSEKKKKIAYSLLLWSL